MGWASGVELAENVWSAIERYLPEEAKGQVALELVKIFESCDCDIMEEASFVSEYLKWDEDVGEWRTWVQSWKDERVTKKGD